MIVSLTDNHQSQIRYDIENDQDDLEKSKCRVDDNIVVFPRNGKPAALLTIDKIRGDHKKQYPYQIDTAIDDRTPHKKRFEYLDIHLLYLSKIIDHFRFNPDVIFYLYYFFFQSTHISYFVLDYVSFVLFLIKHAISACFIRFCPLALLKIAKRYRYSDKRYKIC